MDQSRRQKSYYREEEPKFWPLSRSFFDRWVGFPLPRNHQGPDLLPSTVGASPTLRGNRLNPDLTSRFQAEDSWMRTTLSHSFSVVIIFCEWFSFLSVILKIMWIINRSTATLMFFDNSFCYILSVKTFVVPGRRFSKSKPPPRWIPSKFIRCS